MWGQVADWGSPNQDSSKQSCCLPLAVPLCVLLVGTTSPVIPWWQHPWECPFSLWNEGSPVLIWKNANARTWNGKESIIVCFPLEEKNALSHLELTVSTSYQGDASKLKLVSLKEVSPVDCAWPCTRSPKLEVWVGLLIESKKEEH